MSYLQRIVYENVGRKYRLELPTTILGCLAFCVTIPIYIFYYKGPEIRAKSKFAQVLASDRIAREEGRLTTSARKHYDAAHRVESLDS